jgi:hypothetical protein
MKPVEGLTLIELMIAVATRPAVSYRLTVRVEGPRNTVAMSQAILAF